MKKIISLLLVGIILFSLSCNKEESRNFQKNLDESSFKAPSGLVIPYKTPDLSLIAQEVTGFNELRIVDINYLNVNTGYAAMIFYETNSGMKGNFALVRYPKISFDFKTLKVSKSEDSKVSKLHSGDITVTCKGTCGCFVEGDINPDGKIRFRCGCDDCVATIKGKL